MNNYKSECGEKRYFLGIDTSNYTTSAAVADESGTIIVNLKLPLTIRSGDRGLRQSDALFQHTVNIPELVGKLRGYSYVAVGYSGTPRDEEGSYMPCFLAGTAAAHSAAAAAGAELYKFSHQTGHVRAALYSAGTEELIGREFIAFHVSGGTTELLKCSEGLTIEKIGETEDLNAGQLIDRAGVMLGLDFPCGPALERLAADAVPAEKPRICVRGLYCNLSGAENKVRSFIDEGKNRSEIASYVIEFIKLTLETMTDNVLAQYPDRNLLFAGGVMSNKRINKYFSEKYGAYFAEPQFSSDNAAGIALLCRDRYLKEKGI